MSINASEQSFESQMQSAMKALDNCDIAMQERAIELLRTKAIKIRDSQRKFIQNRSSKLAGLIEVGKLTAKSSSRSWRISIGYSTEAIKEGFEGLIMEYGRPGKTSKGVDKLGRKIGKVEPTPHIRAGFDAVVDEVADEIAEELFDLIEDNFSW